MMATYECMFCCFADSLMNIGRMPFLMQCCSALFASLLIDSDACAHCLSRLSSHALFTVYNSHGCM